MKKLNIKRLAAIGAGAVLLGAAASAAFTDLTKSDIVNETTGVPAISIVGGSNAAVSDFVWAGNIAAKVAQLATKPQAVTQGEGGTAGTPTDLAVTLNVGGRITYSGGVRELQNAALNSASNQVEYYEYIGNSYFKNFANTSANVTRDSNAATAMTIIEQIGVKADGRMYTTTPIKDLVAIVNPSDMNYSVTFTPGITYSFTDTGSDDYIPVYFLGKRYTMDSINSAATNVVLIEEGTEQIYQAGDSLNATGVDGKTYTIRFDSGASVGSSLVASISLLDDQGVVVATDQFSASSDITFRKDGALILTTRPRLQSIASTTVNNSTVYSFKVVSGTSRVELQSGREVPYNANSTGSNLPWVVSFSTSGSTLTGITLKNSTYFFDIGNPLWAVQSLYPGTHTTEFEFFKGTGLDKVGTFKFEGFYDVGVQKSKVEFLAGSGKATGTSLTNYGAVHYFDYSGVEHYVPMAIKLTGTSTSGIPFTFDGQEQTYWTNDPTTVTYLGIENDSATVPIATTDYNITVLTSDTNWDSSAIVHLKGKNSKYYSYLARRANTTGVWLTLVGGSQSSGDTTNYHGCIGVTSAGACDNATQYYTGSLFLLGTALNDANSSNLAYEPYYTEAASDNNFFRPYYYPDYSDYNGTDQGTTTGVYRTAVFKVYEGLGTADTTLNANGTSQLFNIFIDTEGVNAGTVDTANNSKTNMTWPTGSTTAAQYFGTDQNLTTFSEYLGAPNESGSGYKKAYTVNGSKVELANREIGFTLPDKAMKSYFTVTSTNVTTTTTGGEDVGPLAIGEKGETEGGTTVTVKDITGSCAVGSGACTPATYDKIVPVDSLVYTDEATPGGKVVIVGGYFVNSLAQNLTLSDGTTLQDKLTASGDYVAEKLDNGDIVVAGYTAADTGTAAQELIAALDGLLG